LKILPIWWTPYILKYIVCIFNYNILNSKLFLWSALQRLNDSICSNECRTEVWKYNHCRFTENSNTSTKCCKKEVWTECTTTVKKLLLNNIYIYIIPFVRVVYLFSYGREAYIILLLYVFISGVFRIKLNRYEMQLYICVVYIYIIIYLK